MKNIAVVQTAFLGDLLLSIPLLKRLRKFAPDADVHLIARKGLGGLFVELGLADQFYEVDKSKKFFKATHSLPPCDLVLSPHRSLTSARQVARIPSPMKVGYKTIWNGLVFHRRVTWPKELPEALRTLSLLSVVDDELRGLIEEYERREFDINSLRPVPEWASMALDAPARERLEAHRPQNITLGADPIVVLAPGSVWATKRWRVEGYIELAKRLSGRGLQVILTGSPAEVEIGERIAAETRALNLCGQLSLAQTLWLMAQAQAVVSNDSGAMHMAAAMATPSVAIFGPTVLRFGFQPWQNRAKVLERTDLNCRPCSPHGTAKCPLGHHNCMKWITAQEVEGAVLEVMGS